MYIAIVSRPDIAHIINVLSRFVNNFDLSHVNCVKRVLKYLLKTSNTGILYKNNTAELCQVAYADADFANCQDTRKSTSSCIILYANAPVIWFHASSQLWPKAQQRQNMLLLMKRVKNKFGLEDYLMNLEFIVNVDLICLWIIEKRFNCVNIQVRSKARNTLSRSIIKLDKK